MNRSARRERAKRFALSYWPLVITPLLVLGCPVDERTLSPEGNGLEPSFGGDFSTPDAGDPGGGTDAGQGGRGDAGTGAEAGTGEGGTGNASGTGGAGGVPSGGMPAAGGGGMGGVAASAGMTGEAASPACPDVDGDLTPDCEQTLIENSDFDESTEGWNQEEKVLPEWNDQDARMVTESGSMDVINTFTGDSDNVGMNGVFQCLPVNEDATYYAAAEAFIEEGQVPSGSAVIGMFFYDQADCTGRLLLSSTASAGLVGSWQTVNTSLTAPIQAVSLRVRLAVAKPFREPQFKASFDNVLVR